MKTNRILKSMLLSACLLCCGFATTEAASVTVVNDTPGKIGIRENDHNTYDGINPGKEKVIYFPDGAPTKISILFNHVYHHSENHPEEDQIVSPGASKVAQDGERISATKFIESYDVGEKFYYYRYFSLDMGYIEYYNWKDLIATYRLG